MDHEKDTIDEAIASLGRNGVVGLVGVVCLGLGAGVTSWMLFHAAFDTAPDTRTEAALVGSLAGENGDAGASESDQGSTQDIEPRTVPYTPPPVSDSTARIELIGDAVVHISVGDAYTDDGAVILDSDAPIRTYVDGSLVDTVVIDTSVPGEHEIQYRAEDRSGSILSAGRTVMVHSY